MILIKSVTIDIDDSLYDFYKKVGVQAGGIAPEQVMSDALFKLAGSLSIDALRKKDQQPPHNN